MFLEEFERALERGLGGLGVVAAALVAAEAVPGLVDIERDIGPRCLHLLDVAHRDALILIAEMQHHRYLRLLARVRRHHAAVIAYRCGSAGQPRRGEEGEPAAPAIAHRADLAELLGIASVPSSGTLARMSRPD